MIDYRWLLDAAIVGVCFASAFGGALALINLIERHT